VPGGEGLLHLRAPPAEIDGQVLAMLLGVCAVVVVRRRFWSVFFFVDVRMQSSRRCKVQEDTTPSVGK
jgi:hypothetical protein